MKLKWKIKENLDSGYVGMEIWTARFLHTINLFTVPGATILLEHRTLNNLKISQTGLQSSSDPGTQESKTATSYKKIYRSPTSRNLTPSMSLKSSLEWATFLTAGDVIR